MDMWYDGQLRRYWLQFCRIFESFSYESGKAADGTKSIRPIPVKLATKNRQVLHILRNNSENTILSTPQITCEQIDISMAPARRQNPNHVRTVNVFERAIDPLTNRYTEELGNTYSVETYMGVPYDITMRMDLWTSNELQKHQIMEQILMIFNPSIDLQTGDNPIDWTSLTIVEMDTIQWTNREMPIGTDDDIEVSSITFKMPIWINPPAKLRKQNIIHQIITNIGTMGDQEYQEGQGEGYNFSSSDYHTRLVVTPGDHQARVEVVAGPQGNQFEVTLLGGKGLEHDEQGDVFSWRDLLRQYAPYRPNVSQFRIKTTANLDDDSKDIVGTFGFHPTDFNKIWWQPDLETMPVNTLEAIDGILDLTAKADKNNGTMAPARLPGVNGMPEAAEGQRYLLASDLMACPEWTGLEAHVDDIIEFRQGKWMVSFDASMDQPKAVCLNRRSGKQLKWNGEIWTDAISGDYYPGNWRVFL